MTEPVTEPVPEPWNTGDGKTQGSDPTSPREAALFWVIRLQASDVPAHERRAFRAWLAEAPEHRILYDQIQVLWASDALTEALRASNAQPEALLRASNAQPEVARQAAPPTTPMPSRVIPLSRKVTPSLKKHLRPLRSANVAAAILLCLATGLLLLSRDWVQGQWVQTFADHTTAVGERREVALPDGSTVTLDSDSAFDLTGTPQDPRVMLRRGMAYFEVTPRAPGHGFTVETPEANVTVVGTRFSVETNTGRTRVAVRHGIVETSARRETEAGTRMERLTRGEGVSVTAEGQLVKMTPSEDNFAWLDGRLTFHDQPLGAVLADLDRYFPGVILLANDRLATIKISGSYRLDDPASLVRSLARITSATVTDFSPYLLIIR